MKRIIFFLYIVLLTSSSAISQNVTTLIGPNIGINDGIVLDSKGNLYGSDHSGHDVYKYTTDGQIFSVASFQEHPNGITVDEDDNIYVSVPKENKVYKINETGGVEQYGPSVPNPNGLIFDKYSDTLIITSYMHNTISKLSSDGVFQVFIDDNLLNGPLGLTYDDNDILYVSNFNDGKMFSINGGQLEYFATVPGAYLGNDYFSTGYITYLEGFFFASGYATHKVYRIDMEGEAFEYAGSGVAGLLDGPAETARFFYPNGIIPSFTGDSLLVSGYQYHAIRVITDLALSSLWIPMDEINMRVYPNPTSKTIKISFLEKAFVPENLYIYDSNGRYVAEVDYHYMFGKDHELNISYLHPGNYIIVCTHDNVSMAQKIVVY